MTLRDLTPRQRDLLVRRAGKQRRYWGRRYEGWKSDPQYEVIFNCAFNEGAKALLEMFTKNTNLDTSGK